MTKSSNFLQNLLKPFKSSSGRGGQSEEELERIAAQEQKQFTFESLVSATKNFDPSNKLGQGGFGPVYKGTLNDGREIAVKRLSNTSNQGKKEFENEAKLLARVQHRNVVNLLGYCAHGTDKLLVYEYVANQSLDKFLFNEEKRQQLDWKRRFDIITGVARGLLYLHEDAHKIIIHRDIKASNILLDEKWVPKISDFGMARLFPEDETHVNTRVAGTNGYMAPEYVMHGRLTDKADVFSFGVLVIELISGWRNSTFNQQEDHDGTLLDRAYKLHRKNRSMELADPMIATSDAADAIKTCIHIGLLCTQGDPSQRPNMKRVVVLLSKKPGNLEEPGRPGTPGSRYRRSHRRPWNSSTGGTSGDSESHTFDSTSNTHSAATTASTSRTSPRSDPRGKRPMKG